MPWAHVAQTLAVLHARGRPRAELADVAPSLRLEASSRALPTAVDALAAWFTSGASRCGPEVLAATAFSWVLTAAWRRQASSTAQP
ncbi:MAG: hypothetical protein JNM10_02360 [Planctomycetia bacterium]|nr:hypothetical protein [Planctomycetia bacterium]